ncbi:MAG: N,N'-diacetylchitobiose phosphorylase [Oscillospiraceae bacterium]|nr:N,N'-diacetylchitobiose phosphorylase [Oscillospiraceae bacterium]
MKYGHFDAERREYVITRPDTPAPWANYLGSPAYGAIISNNAGGYSFVESGAAGRILRYRFNEQDSPGRYIYLRDERDGAYWSASWQPVGADLNEYRSVCRHGTGYTVIESQYRGIETETLYTVPIGASHEVWAVTVRNPGAETRELSVFGYAELTNEGHYEQDGVNLQYTQFITRTYFKDGMITQTINENFVKAAHGHVRQCRFFALCGADTASFCGDREAFLGPYGSYGAPGAVKAGDCGGVLNYGGNACGALQARLTLAPGQERTLIFLLGQKEPAEAEALHARYRADSGRPAGELAELKAYWHGQLARLQVRTPDGSFDAMMNTWNAYQCFITFIWSRAASLIYCGLRNGYGYRDTVQDIQGIIHLAPEQAREKILFMLSAQVDHGGALPLVRYTHTPGRENTPEDPEYAKQTGHPSYRADDALWLFPTVYKYIAETGELSFLDEVVPYANRGQDTVYGHLRRAVEFSLARLGVHGLPAGLHADWNDCLRLGEKGVSVFVAMQLYYAFEILRRFAQKRGEEQAVSEMEEKKRHFESILESVCWDGDRYVRGVSQDGEVVGARQNPEAKLWLNPQSWAVVSGLAGPARGEAILDLVYAELNTPYGARLMAPAYQNHPFDGALALLFNPGMKENGGVFLQSQGWLILAEALLGRGDRAFAYYRESCPAAQNDIAELRRMEPYVYSQFTECGESPFAGRSWVHWLTGTASTVMVGCVEGILGLRPDLDGLTLSPAIPAAWDGLTIEKAWRGKRLRIEVRNPAGKQGGCSSLTLNGEALEGNRIPEDRLKEDNEIVLVM